MWSFKIYLLLHCAKNRKLKNISFSFLKRYQFRYHFNFLKWHFVFCNRANSSYSFQLLLLSLTANNDFFNSRKSLPTYHDLNRTSKAVIVEFRYFYFPIILCHQVKKNDINKNFDPSTQTKTLERYRNSNIPAKHYNIFYQN